MKNYLCFFAFLAIAVLALAGCASSISQEDYDAVVAERDQLRQDPEATSAATRPASTGAGCGIGRNFSGFCIQRLSRFGRAYPLARRLCPPAKKYWKSG